MPTYHNSSDQQPQFKITPKKNPNFFSLVSTHNINNNYLKKSFVRCWLKAVNKKGIKTVNKVPQRKGWANPNQKEMTVEDLLRKYKEYGVRTGTKLGNKYFEGVDIDISEKLAPSLRKRFEVNFEFLAKKHRISYIKTKRGYHVYCLFDELTPSEGIYHVDKYGNKRNVGSVLSKGRQLQGVGSKDKKWVDNGKWFWHLKDREELKAKLACFFFLLSDVKESVRKTAQKEVSNTNTNKSPKVKQILSQNLYKFLKLENIRIISKQPTKKADHYRINYLDKWQNKGFFFLDSYFRDKKARIQPNLVGDFLLMRGYKYQFFYGFG